MTTEATIAQLFDRWNAALQTGDPQTVAALYAPDAILLPTVSNKVRRSPAEIEDYFVQFLKKRPRGTIHQQNIRIFGDLAIDSGVYAFDLTTEDGEVQVLCRYTYVYRRDGDDWRIIEHQSSMMPEYVDRPGPPSDAA